MKNYRNIGLLIIFGSISYSSFVGTLFLIALREKVSNPIYISLGVISQKVIKIFIETPLGVIADKYGVRKMLMAVPFLKIAAVLFIAHNSTASIIMCTIVQGISVSMRSGKIEGSIYNSLKKERREKSFPKVLSLYFMISDLTMGVLGYISGTLYQRHGINGVIVITIIGAIASIATVLLINDEAIAPRNKLGAATILRGAVKSFSHDKRLVMGAIILTLYNFFGWQFVHTQKLFLVEKGVSAQAMVKFYGITHVLMSLGSLLAFLAAGVTPLVAPMLGWAGIILAMLILSVVPKTFPMLGENFPIVGIVFLIYPIIYPLLQVRMTKYLEDRIPTHQRMTITSFSNLLTIISNILFNLLVGFIAHFCGGYTASLATVAALSIVISMLPIFSFIRTENRNSSKNQLPKATTVN